MFRDDPQSLVDISIRGMGAIVRGQVIEPYFHQPATPIAMHMSRRVIVGVNHDLKTILANDGRHGFRLKKPNPLTRRRARYRTVGVVAIQHKFRRLANFLTILWVASFFTLSRPVFQKNFANDFRTDDLRRRRAFGLFTPNGRDGVQPTLRLPLASELERPLPNCRADRLGGGDGVESAAAELRFVVGSQEVNQTQGLTLRDRRGSPEPAAPFCFFHSSLGEQFLSPGVSAFNVADDDATMPTEFRSSLVSGSSRHAQCFDFDRC